MVSDDARQPDQPDDGQSSVSERPPEPLGRIREYDLIEKIGQGGMGTVYKASHTMLERLVAVKLLPSERMNDEESVSRFRREMKAVGKLVHPNIVHAYDAGEETGTHFLVMEYVDGLDVDVVRKHAGQLRIADACEIIRQAAIGLQHAYESGLVHRDIKPSNLLLSRNGQVKILDLGLALLHEGDVSMARNLTSTGQIMGTLDYMAPEQADDTHAVDIRADIYSLGCTLYALLAGKPPFGGAQYTTPVRKLAAHMTKRAPLIRERRDDVPEELVAIIERMLAKQPDERFATPGEVAIALQSFVEGSDLPQLLEQAIAAQPAQREADSSLRETEGLASSPLTGTRPSQFPLDSAATTDHRAVDATLASPPPSIARSMKLRVFVALGITLLLIACGVIIIKIRDKSGRVIGTVTVPEGGSFEVTEYAPTVIEEPPPLEEWLKGREIITVKQDGTADFDTIQAALDALKPGEVVEVLDTGPYLERLRIEKPPHDTGIISRVETRLIVAQPREINGDSLHGHEILDAKLFRISGFVIGGEKTEGLIPFVVRAREEVIIERCVMLPAARQDPVKDRALHAYGESPTGEATIFIRDCAFNGSVTIGRAELLVTRNHFRSAPVVHCNVFLPEDLRGQRAEFRRNVFEAGGRTGIGFEVAGGHVVLVEENTFFQSAPVSFGRVTPRLTRIRKNLFATVDGIAPAITMHSGAENFTKDVLKSWQVGPNGYAKEVQGERNGVLPLTVDDIVAIPQFIDANQTARNHARLQVDSPLAAAEPSLGALPVGPAPPEGDWFTRLQERWKDVIAESDDGSAQLDIEEPPPLEEWLKGREIITVAKDGNADFDTIQAALDALKPGQFVEVLDGGPYKETLQSERLPPDSGLISRRNTVIEIDSWTTVAEGRAYDSVLGHQLDFARGFRLSGFAFTGQAAEDATLLSVTGARRFTLENCVFQLAPHSLEHVRGLGVAVGGVDATTVCVRECGFSDQCQFHWFDGRGRVRLLRNCFRDSADGRHVSFSSVSADETVREVVVAHCVFAQHGAGGLGLGGPFQLADVQHNTFLSNKGILIHESARLTGGSVRNTLFAGGDGVRLDWADADAATGLDRSAWPVESNGYQIPPGNRALVRSGPTDVISPVEFLSTDPGDRHYLRLPTDSPFAANDGTGSRAYIGALPPGPAPPEGDWFTRLQKRWNDVIAESDNGSAQLDIEEPPPLEEWLKGREIITVAKDGSGQFDTIQAALNALQPGQVVRVLDRGPYHESLLLDPVPTDTGLVTTCKTEVIAVTLTRDRDGSDRYVGHQLQLRNGGSFRLSGFHFRSSDLPLPEGGQLATNLYVASLGRVSIDNCQIDGGENDDAWISLGCWGGERDGTAARFTVRECRFTARCQPMMASTEAVWSLRRSWVLTDHNSPCLAISGTSGHIDAQQNVLHGSGHGILVLGETFSPAGIEIVLRENTFKMPELSRALTVVKPQLLKRLIAERNIFVGMRFVADSNAGDFDLSRLQFQNNWVDSRLAGEGGGIGPLPTEYSEPVVFLSESPSTRNYLRIASDASLNRNEQGKQIGALPPGPAPPEGDWFTRLRERWGGVADVEGAEKQ